MPTKKIKKQGKMDQFFKPLQMDRGQTLMTKFFTSSNKEENKFQYLFEREEARRKKIEQDLQEKIERERAEERRIKQEKRKQEKEAEKLRFEADQEMRWQEEKLKYEGKFIIPGFYLGSRYAAQNLEWINGSITAILNVSQEVKNYFEGHFVKPVTVSQSHEQQDCEMKDISEETKPSVAPCLLNYKRIVCQDAADQDLSQYFSESVEFIDSVVKSGGAVLVHCREGLSRSPSTIIAYLMTKKGWSLAKAYDHVLEQNKKLRINDGFKRQLMQFEFSLFNVNSYDFFDKRTTRTSNTRKTNDLRTSTNTTATEAPEDAKTPEANSNTEMETEQLTKQMEAQSITTGNQRNSFDQENRSEADQDSFAPMNMDVDTSITV